MAERLTEMQWEEIKEAVNTTRYGTVEISLEDDKAIIRTTTSKLVKTGPVTNPERRAGRIIAVSTIRQDKS